MAAASAANAATIACKLDIVHRFVAATIRGMKDAFADRPAAGAIMHKIVPQTEAVAELASALIDPP
jgi:hypothetical protein